MTAYQKAKGLLRGLGLKIKQNINIGQKYRSRQERQHYIKRDLRQQHSKAATHDNTAW